MAFLLAVMGGAGVALFVTGLPVLRRPTLEERVAPHLPGALLRLASPTNWLQRIAARFPGSETRNDEVAKRLISAGSSLTPFTFRTEQIAWGLLAVAATAFLSIAFVAGGVPLDPTTAPLLAGLAGASGFYARDWWLGRQTRRRSASMKEELPTAMDLMTLALIAGESPAAGMTRTAAVMGGGIREEFDRILNEVRAGASFRDALQEARDATNDHSMARFLDALITGIDKGSPLADVLRGQADEARHARGREMFEVAGRREVLMLVPVVFLIMPVVILYALFPGLASLDLFVP